MREAGRMRTTAQILRDDRGPALFSFGFRPFFLGAAIWSALACCLGLVILFGPDEAMAAMVTADWHRHEMLFGYGSAVIVGYMIVAGANWTGHYPCCRPTCRPAAGALDRRQNSHAHEHGCANGGADRHVIPGGFRRHPVARTACRKKLAQPRAMYRHFPVGHCRYRLHARALSPPIGNVRSGRPSA